MHFQATLERRRTMATYGLPMEWLTWVQGRAGLDVPNPSGPSETLGPSQQPGNDAEPVVNSITNASNVSNNDIANGVTWV